MLPTYIAFFKTCIALRVETRLYSGNLSHKIAQNLDPRAQRESLSIDRGGGSQRTRIIKRIAKGDNLNGALRARDRNVLSLRKTYPENESAIHQRSCHLTLSRQSFILSFEDCPNV
jgi:hypothetical protein